jgi:hypothetical protein
VALNGGIHSYQVLAKSSSKQVGNIAFLQPQSAKAASKATSEMQASADSNKMPSIFQLIVGSKQMYEMKPQQDLINFSLSKTISIARPSAQTHLVDRIFETSNEFNQWMIVTFTKTNNDIPSSSSEEERHNFSLLKSSSHSAPNSLFERNDKFIVVSRSRAPDKSPSKKRLPVGCYLLSDPAF